MYFHHDSAVLHQCDCVIFGLMLICILSLGHAEWTILSIHACHNIHSLINKKSHRRHVNECVFEIKQFSIEDLHQNFMKTY